MRCRFELRVRGDGTLQVDEVELNVDGGDEAAAAYSEVPYLGPAFDELDEGLQAELMHFLDARGVNGELAAYLTAISFDKEQRCVGRKGGDPTTWAREEERGN